MKRILIAAALSSGSGTIFGGNLTLEACKSNDCEPYHEGNLGDFVEPMVTTFAGFEPKKIPMFTKKKEDGSSGFIRFLAGATGHAIGYVKEAFNGMKGAILESGYDKFVGKLSGPSGSVEFEYNLKTDKWVIKN